MTFKTHPTSHMSVAALLGLAASLTAQSTPFGSAQVVTNYTSAGAHSVNAADLDGDGDMDTIHSHFFDKTVTWCENLDGRGSFGPQNPVTLAANGATDAYAADMDGDGDMDVISASYFTNTVAWHENTDGLGTFGAHHVITTIAGGVGHIYAIDIEGDGDMDVLSASILDGGIRLHRNQGAGSWGLLHLATAGSGARSVYADDIDGNGSPDVLAVAPGNNAVLWIPVTINSNGGTTIGTVSFVTTNAPGASDVYATDVDGDGDADALVAFRSNKVAWYANDGAGNFGAEQVITTAVSDALSVYAADLDGDGDPDVLSASGADRKIAWYENTDGLGTFGAQHVVHQNTPTAVEASIEVFAADIDGDGDIDVLSADGYEPGPVAWFENGSKHPVVTVGTGCGAPLPLLLESTVPSLGAPWEMTTYGPLSGMWAFYLGDQVINPGIPVPVGTHVGCSIYTNANIYAAMLPTLGFTANLSIAVPNYPALLGFTCAVQATSAAAGGGFFTSNGVQVTVGR